MDIQLSNFAEDCFIDSKERAAVRNQQRDLDESPESEKIITDALEKRYPGYRDRIKCTLPDVVTHLNRYFDV